MSVYLRGNVYWCQFRLGGELVRLSTGKSDKAAAEKEARRLQVDKEQSIPARRRGVGSLETLSVWDVQTRQASHTSEASSNRVLDLWVPLLRYFGSGCDPIDLTSAAVFAYVKARQIETRKDPMSGAAVRRVRNQTIRRELQALKRGLTEARRRKWVAEVPEPWPSLEKDPPHPRMRGKLHSEAAIQKVVYELPPAAVDGVVFALATGVRLEELHRVRRSNIQPLPNGGAAVALLQLVEEGTKTRKVRSLGLNQDAYEIAERRLATFGDQLFPRYGYTQALKRTAKRLGLPPMNMRDLRHTFASTALRLSGGNLSAVAKAMGHSELEITTLYLHARDEDVLNLAATVITPDRSQRVERKVRGRVSAVEMKEKMARGAGVEPATFGFGDQKNRDIAAEFDLGCVEKVQRILALLTPADHNGRSQSQAGEYPRVRLLCGGCGREQEQEQAPCYECLFCGSHGVVPLIEAEEIMEVEASSVVESSDRGAICAKRL